MTIKKTSSGYQVKSEGGKNLSKPNLTKPQAEKRLAQVEAFKHMDAKPKPRIPIQGR
jgi:hypothetical protein